MRRIRVREEDDSSRGLIFFSIGALAGVAAGMILTERMGGLSGLTRRVRQGFGEAAEELVGRTFAFDDADYDDEDYEPTEEEELEERVLEAFRNDPILSERAVDIGAMGSGVIELTGWVHEPEESAHAVTISRGTPGVETVVNRLEVRSEAEQLDSAGLDYDADDLHGGHWNGQQVGTGKRRQGRGKVQPDRHEDPAPELQAKALSEEAAIESAADDLPG
ncbi:MAG TPA: BON domain-containing protein [Gemmatimonadales bacterium]|nr:BON domain-containing protein [Gemmatimonadales bacterium]